MILTIINEIAKTGSSKAKLTILQNNKSNETLKNVFRLAYNKRIVFGMKKIPVDLPCIRGVVSLDYALNELEYRFATRKITGNAAAERLAELMAMLGDDDREVLRRIILRDLECGASDSSARKVWGNDIAPDQPCMTASSFSEKALSKIKFPAYAQLKADGTRCMFIKQNGQVTAWSRNGKSFIGLSKITRALEDIADDNFVLDGELVYVEPKKTSSLDFLFGNESDDISEEVADRQTGNGIVGKSLKGTITDEESDCIVFQCWDHVDEKSYWSGKDLTPYLDRLINTQRLVKSLNTPCIQSIETTLVQSAKEAREVYMKYVDMGLEGIILKNLVGIWENKRSANQVKFKEVIDIDMIIVDVYEHTKDKNKVGGFTVESKCGKIRCNVGSGFTDTDQEKVTAEDGSEQWLRIPLHLRGEKDREYLMSIKDQLIGKVVELECNGVLERKKRKPEEAPFKLFLPIFKTNRLDKDKEQANTKEEIFG